MVKVNKSDVISACLRMIQSIDSDRKNSLVESLNFELSKRLFYYNFNKYLGFAKPTIESCVLDDDKRLRVGYRYCRQYNRCNLIMNAMIKSDEDVVLMSYEDIEVIRL